MGLELPLTPRTPLRSSLRKDRYTGPAPTHGRASPWASGWSSGGGTPTNENSSSEEVYHPLSKTDSGFVSSSRVRFSPRGGDKIGRSLSPTVQDRLRLRQLKSSEVLASWGR